MWYRNSNQMRPSFLLIDINAKDNFYSNIIHPYRMQQKSASPEYVKLAKTSK